MIYRPNRKNDELSLEMEPRESLRRWSDQILSCLADDRGER